MRRLSATAAAVAALATLGAGAGTAFAAGSSSPATGSSSPAGAAAKAPATLQGVQAKASKAITVRVDALNKAIAKVQAAKDLGADQAALLTTLRGDVSGLQALGQKIAGDTTIATAAADSKTIYTNYRALALALPVSRLVAATDRINATAIPKLTAAETRLAGHVTPVDSAQVTPLLDDLKAQLAAAGTATKGLQAQLLSLTPAAYNANHAVLDQPRSAVKTAAGDLKKALADAKQARGDIKAARHSTASTTSPAPAA